MDLPPRNILAMVYSNGDIFCVVPLLLFLKQKILLRGEVFKPVPRYIKKLRLRVALVKKLDFEELLTSFN